MERLPDLELVNRARNADREAFGVLVSRYQKALEGILLSFTGDRERARDLVQDAILRAYRHLDRYEVTHKFSTWFFRIGVNLAISARRRANLEHKFQETEGRQEESAEVDAPLVRAMRQEDAGRLRDAVARLPDRYRDVLEMRYGRELGCKEIAERLGTTPNTISIILFRAKQRLKEDLEQE